MIYSKVSLRHFLGSLVNTTVYQISCFSGDIRTRDLSKGKQACWPLYCEIGCDTRIIVEVSVTYKVLFLNLSVEMTKIQKGLDSCTLTVLTEYFTRTQQRPNLSTL